MTLGQLVDPALTDLHVRLYFERRIEVYAQLHIRLYAGTTGRTPQRVSGP